MLRRFARVDRAAQRLVDRRLHGRPSVPCDARPLDRMELRLETRDGSFMMRSSGAVVAGSAQYGRAEPNGDLGFTASEDGAMAKKKFVSYLRVSTARQPMSARPCDSLAISRHLWPSLTCLACHSTRLGKAQSRLSCGARRKLETHPTTGAAQLVEIRETVKEISASASI
jgi:hypothetical protein